MNIILSRIMVALKNLKADLSGIRKSLGPGILFAGAAIGGSHLVQSTRAGANYGFSLIWVILLVNLFKYPFYEAAHRYTAATGRNLLEGYLKLGKAALWAFFFLAILAAIMNCAAVTLIAAALFGLLLGLQLSTLILSACLLGVIVLLLVLGRYPLMDKAMKVMILVLGVTTIIAVSGAYMKGAPGLENFQSPDLFTLGSFSFLIALMGWMPAPIDISVWSSLWALERRKQTNHTASLKEALVDFHFGYAATIILAIAFLSLGALVMCGTGETFSKSGLVFSRQLVTLYTDSLGSWSFSVIALLAFTTMFSTTITVFDGYARTMDGSVKLLLPKLYQKLKGLYWLSLVFFIIISLIIIGRYVGAMKTLVDLATTIAFLSAPLLAFLNYKVMTLPDFPSELAPGRKLKILSIAGIIFLSAFSLIFILWRFCFS